MRIFLWVLVGLAGLALVFIVLPSIVSFFAAFHRWKGRSFDEIDLTGTPYEPYRDAIIGGIAYGIYRYFGFGQTDVPPEPTPRTGQTITYADNHTVLLILDEPEQRCSSTFLK